VPIVLEPFSDRHIPAVHDFNKRISEGGIPYRFPESPVSRWLPRRDAIQLYQEGFVAMEDNMIRGAYLLKRQPFACHGELLMTGDYQLPISEGTIDSRYALVGLLMLKDALKREPLLFALGIGGYQESLTRMLKVMKWPIVSCPFFFKVNHPSRFFREMRFLRRKKVLGPLFDLMAFSGLGWSLTTLLQAVRRRPLWQPADIEMKVVHSFSCWADELWKQVKDNYAFIGLRDATTLNALYPVGDSRYKRLNLISKEKTIGWAVVLDTQMNDDDYFGSMKVGAVIDCLAEDGQERHVVTMASRFLEQLDVDLIVTNQLHRSWCNAFTSNGYLPGPSNYVFAVSPGLAKKLHPFHIAASKTHLTRGDGDGPGRLLGKDSSVTSDDQKELVGR